MPRDALLIVLLSAVLHAVWNLVMRGSGGPVAFARWLLWAIAAIVVAPLVVCEFVLTPLGWPVWWIGLASGGCCGVYYIGLARAYRSTDFTTAYPVARASPVIIIGLVDLLNGRDPTAIGWVGMVLVVVGCLLAPLKSWRDIRLKHYFNHSMFWIGVTALGTVGYSLLDDTAATRILALQINGIEGAARYTAVFAVSAAFSYELLYRLTRTRVTGDPKLKWSSVVLAGVLVYVAYGMIVWVYQMVDQVSYVVSFRQFSIVVGVIAAYALFHEHGRFVRITASILITGGLIMIGIWG